MSPDPFFGKKAGASETIFLLPYKMTRNEIVDVLSSFLIHFGINTQKPKNPFCNIQIISLYPHVKQTNSQK